MIYIFSAWNHNLKVCFKQLREKFVQPNDPTNPELDQIVYKELDKEEWLSIYKDIYRLQWEIISSNSVL